MTTHEQALKEVGKNIAILEQVKKYGKVLEILKNKQVDVYKLFYSKNVYEYNVEVELDRHLTKTEFNLIKEWL